jgi:rhamnosyl/mannosyltransferase
MKKSKPKKILFLQAFPLQGCGSGIYTRELAVEVNKNPMIKTAIVCPDSRENISNLKIYPLELPFQVAFSGHPDWPVSKMYKDLQPKEVSEVFRSFLGSITRAIEDFQPDLIHVQHISILLWVANFIRATYGINFIVTTHGTGILGAKDNKIYVPLSQDSLKRAKKIISVSKDTKERMLELFGNEFESKTSVIPVGIKTENFPADKTIKIINEKYKLDGQKIVLFAGKLTNLKGADYLVSAAKDIKGDVYIIGDGPEKKNLEDLARKLNLNNVHFLGYMGDESRDELIEFYYRANVFVAPSVTDEALGLVILEAMACNTPVVATRKGGIPTIVKDGVNGFLIRPKNSKAIAEACNKILGNENLQRKMSINAKNLIEDKFSWQTIAHKYINIYRNACASLPKQKENKLKITENHIQTTKI